MLFSQHLQCLHARPSAARVDACVQTRRPHRQNGQRPVASAALQEAPSRNRPRPGEKKGFIEEMRIAAMKHHTRGQAPKEGQRPETENPAPQSSTPTLKGYLRFLAESKQVYEVLEQIVNTAANPEYARFQNTGLERSERLAHDIEWMQREHSLPAPEVLSSGPGSTYAQYVQSLAESDPAAFICHFYNFYFAHTSGGKMIGARISSMLLDGAVLEFYKWKGGSYQPMIDRVRAELNDVAEGWTREQKDHCIKETPTSFQHSGNILRTIVETQ